MSNFFNSNHAGFDSPIELLEACHEKVRRFAKLAQRIALHVEKCGIDSKAQEAAESVLRYFTIAAPLHHQDEEDDLFPALKNLSPATLDEDSIKNLNSTIQTLESEHVALGLLWSEIENWLRDLVENKPHAAPSCLDEFAGKYIDHAEREEKSVYPFAQLLSPETLRTIGMNMAQRRGHKMLDLSQAI